MAGLNPLYVYDWAFSDFAPHAKARADEGLQPLSLSMYGDPSAPLFAAVWDRRPGPSLRLSLNTTLAAFQIACAQNAVAGYYPVLVSATGGGTAARISAIFEQRPAAQATEITIGHDQTTFPQLVIDRKFQGWIARSVMIYDDATNGWRVAVVWEKNSANVAWTIVAGLTPTDYQEHFEAQWSGWARPSVVTGSTQGLMLAIFRDDQIGPIGTGFVARHEQTSESFKQEYGTWFSKGFWVVCLQGYGAGATRRLAAIFVNNETPVQRTLRISGTPVVNAIDQAVIDFMKLSNIRGAAIAIAKGTTLVLARGYTWAEPDYPAVQPTTGFRLASCSKLITALGIHQLAAEGIVSLDSPLPQVLPLTAPTGATPTNSVYLNATVSSILQYPQRFPRYEGSGPNVASAFHTQLPVTSAQIASYMVAQPPLSSPDPIRLDDFGYFLAGEIIKRSRQMTSLPAAVMSRITGPLHITRLRTARSLLSAQPTDEARFHSRDLQLMQSVMTPDRRLVPREYGDEPLENMEPSGGLSAAATDLVRVLAAMNARPYTPLGRPAVDRLLKDASVNGRNGHGFDKLRVTNAAEPRYEGAKGGLLQTSQSGLWFADDEFSYVVLWNGLHTESNLTLEGSDAPGWYPTFDKVLQAAAATPWSKSDLFPTFGMPPLPVTQENWRRCSKCHGLFFGGSSITVCPAGGSHSASGSGSYRVMRNSPFPYGQQNWRCCAKCQSLFYGEKTPGVCAAGGPHDLKGSADYTLVNNSPYNEPQQNWHWCRKCQGLFFAEMGRGVCPAGGGHDPTGSGNYSITGADVEANEVNHLVRQGTDAQMQEA